MNSSARKDRYPFCQTLIGLQVFCYTAAVFLVIIPTVIHRLSSDHGALINFK